MKGTVIKATTSLPGSKPHDLRIKGEDGNTYFAHLGDIKNNEEKLFGKTNDTLFLDTNDYVEFDPVKSTSPRAIHIKKIS